MKLECFSKKQLLTLTWWCDSSPFREADCVICDGAVRSGKTLCMGISFICWAMRRFNNHLFGLCGKTIVSLRRNVLTTLLPVLNDLGFSCTDMISKNAVQIEFGNTKNTFYLFGGKDEGSSALIQGVTFAGVLMDEVALMPRSFVEQAMARCSVSSSKIWFNCNPESSYHWFYQEWIKKAKSRNALYIHFTMEDNPSLSRKIINRYKRMYSGMFYRRFILGEWVTAQGRVYDFFDERYIKKAPSGGFEKYAISCDYGTSNPTSLGLWGLSSGTWFRFSEYYYDSRLEGAQKTDAEYVAELKKLAGNLPLYAVVVDPSAASFIEALRREGLPVAKANNDVLYGIRLTADMLKSGKIAICDRCYGAIEEFYLYCWDENKQNGKDCPKKEHDHAMDEIRYFVSTVAAGYESAFAVTSVHRE